MLERIATILSNSNYHKTIAFQTGLWRSSVSEVTGSLLSGTDRPLIWSVFNGNDQEQGSILYETYRMALQTAMGVISGLGAIVNFYPDMRDSRRSDWVLHLLIAGHLSIAVAFLAKLSSQEYQRPASSKFALLKASSVLLNCTLDLRHVFRIWLTAVSPFGSLFLETHASEDGNLFVVGLSLMDGLLVYSQEVSQATLALFSLLSLSVLACCVSPLKSCVLTERFFRIVSLWLWLFSRSKLRVHKWTGIACQTRSKFLTKHQVGMALAIDIIRSAVGHFWSKVSSLYAVASLSALSQLLEGRWAELTLLDDDSLGFGDGSPPYETGMSSSVHATLDGVLTLTSNLQPDFESSIDVVQNPEDDLIDDITTLGTSLFTLPDRRSCTESKSTSPTMECRSETVSSCAPDTVPPESSGFDVLVVLNESPTNVQAGMFHDYALVNEASHELDIMTCDTSGLFEDEGGPPIVRLPKSNITNTRIAASSEKPATIPVENTKERESVLVQAAELSTTTGADNMEWLPGSTESITINILSSAFLAPGTRKRRRNSLSSNILHSGHASMELLNRPRKMLCPSHRMDEPEWNERGGYRRPTPHNWQERRAGHLRYNSSEPRDTGYYTIPCYSGPVTTRVQERPPRR